MSGPEMTGVDGARPHDPDGQPNPGAEARMALIFALRQHGVTDANVLRAIEETPREAFLDGSFRDRALSDIALPIACGQTISQPSVVGLMTQALAATPRCKVLEVGTGSGYQAAILSRLARRVYTVERHRPLARVARKRLEALGRHTVSVMSGDGAMGLPDQAPFDRIMVTAAAEDLPGVLLSQLREGGIMVAPIGDVGEVQQLIKIVKTSDGLDYTDLGPVRFVPLLAGLAQDEDN